MLSRVAENLFWIGRYVERAENLARLVDAARRMTALPRDVAGQASNEWSSVLFAGGAQRDFGKAIETATADQAIQYLIFDRSNPSSVASCLTAARENGRAIRFALTQECWEALNTAWSELRSLDLSGGLPDLLDWIKAKSAAFRGSMHGTMLRGDGYDFLRLGMSIERVDSTARLLDVKYHVLLPSLSDVGAGKDHYQWLSVLQAASAQRAYFFVTKSDVSARGVAEFLVLNPLFPRSILFNLRRAERSVESLVRFYGQDVDCRLAVKQAADTLESHSIEDIFRSGLHEYLTALIDRNYEIANQLGKAYGFAPAVEEGALADGTTGQ